VTGTFFTVALFTLLILLTFTIFFTTTFLSIFGAGVVVVGAANATALAQKTIANNMAIFFIQTHPLYQKHSITILATLHCSPEPLPELLLVPLLPEPLPSEPRLLLALTPELLL
jgi:hypothetical protein